MSQSIRCPALMIVAPASGQGKTLVTAGLARLLTKQGMRVRVFKCGPDFLDPLWHTLASGHEVYNLDLWLNGEEDVRRRLYQAAKQADLILIEGVMGLFDGDPSAADLSIKLGIPVLAVIDASAMAGTFGAIAYGLRHYCPSLPWAGVLANRVAGVSHARMLASAVCENPMQKKALDAGWLGALYRSEAGAMPERHLGLTVASELADATSRLDAIADLLATEPVGQMSLTDWQRWAVEFPEPPPLSITPYLAGQTIAVARDAAFCFIYPSNLDALRELGANVVFFSPVADELIPQCDALWLPGGYPELHAPALSGAEKFRGSLQLHLEADKPVWAECGGMMALFQGLSLVDSTEVPMWGILPGYVRMQKRLVALGPQQWVTSNGQLRGHTFHHSLTETTLTPLSHTEPQGVYGKPEAVYGMGSLRASYFHAWFPSNPKTTAMLFSKALQ
jgi:cobyrinic acid a,c-diamide synthase